MILALLPKFAPGPPPGEPRIMPDDQPSAPSQPFQYRNGQLFCEDVPLTEVAHRIGTPCYVYSKHAIRENYRRFHSAFAQLESQICYAVKANSNLEILRLLQNEGSGFDVVSGGELHRLRALGIDASRVVFSGVGKSPEEVRMALDWGAVKINIESLEEIEAVGREARQKEISPLVSFRINPDVDARTHPYIATGLRENKFGIDIESWSRIPDLLRAWPELRFQGVGFHIGSQILELEPFLEAFDKLKALADRFRKLGFAVEFLNLGGGFGIPYQGEPPADLRRYARHIERHRGDYKILFEPGRFIVGSAGALLNRVLYRKIGHCKNFVIVDGAMNDLMRPTLYNAYHRILAVEPRNGSIQADVVGPICESGDFFARARNLPNLAEGDFLAVIDAGAYGFVLSSNYNSRPRPAEVLIDQDQIQLIRQRELYQDLLRGEMA